MFDPASKRRGGHPTAKTFEVLLYCTNDRDAERRVVRDRCHMLAGVGILLIAAAGGWYWWQRRKKAVQPIVLPAVEPVVEPVPEMIVARPEPLPEPHPVVMIRYDDSEIDRLLATIPETHLLTARELEVLREILHGRKQGEVAYYLGIEVSTVKDFYRKIYDKLGVPNKDGLFRMVSEYQQER